MYQKTIIVGRLGQDPTMRYTSSGDAVTSLSVAVDNGYTRNGERVNRTTWFRVAVWGKQAEPCNQYLKKGRMVLVEGEVSASAYAAKDGEARASLDVRAWTVKFLGGAQDNAGASNQVQDIVEEDIPF